jgi:hypothetical protein
MGGVIDWWNASSALKVEIIGGSGPFDYLAPALVAATAAVFGAWLTVTTASRRHKEQLDHDTRRQAAQLAHNQALRDREQIQSTLDIAVERAIGAFRSAGRFDRAAKEVEAGRRRLSTGNRAGDTALFADFETALFETLRRSLGETDRVELRLRETGFATR